MKRKFGYIASLGYATMKPADVCASLAKLGYTGVEWTPFHFHPRAKSEAELRELVRATKDSGLEISEVVVMQDIVCQDAKKREDRIKLVVEFIRAAATTGVTTLNLFSGPALWDPEAPKIGRNISLGETWSMVLSAFEVFVKAAEQHKVQLVLENVWGMLCHDYYSARPLIDKFNSPHLGVNFDPSHDVLAGNLDVGWIIRQWGKRIKHVHLKDAVGIPELGKFLFPLLGEGEVDWASMARALDEVGYDGFLSVEFESFAYNRQVLKNDPEACARISMESIKQLFP
jgi:sugar phosphate isomerase/epimerase